jgi:hypothetical protein
MGSGLKPSPFYLLRKIAQIAVSELHAREVEVLPNARGSSAMTLVPTSRPKEPQDRRTEKR